MKNSKTHYSADDIESKILAALRKLGLNPEKLLTPLELATLDHFHTGGYRSSLILEQMAQIEATDRVLDIGAGLAGPARMLAASPGCFVDCIELSIDYCKGAKLLNRITGLEDKVRVHQGSALSLPFGDNSFDVVWMQNVGMNIEDKQSLYQEFYRVLKPGGRFAFQEMTIGSAPIAYFPLPWASSPGENFLISLDQLCLLLEKVGFRSICIEDASKDQLAGSSSKGTGGEVIIPKLSLSTYVENLAQKAENSQRALREGQIRFVRAVFRAD